MRILILGGTGFAGRWLVYSALQRGHDVSIFTRGSRVERDVEHLTGDRRGDLSAIAGGTWDAVIDTSAYVPSAVSRAMDALRGRIGHYTVMSSISVYDSFSAPGIDEHHAVAAISAEALSAAEALETTGMNVNSRTYGETYGALKARCELAAEEAMPGRALCVRPGLIVGPGDTTRRFTYWVRRIAEGSDVLAPGAPGRTVQFIDARDLAHWMIFAIEHGRTGVYNAVGPGEPLTMGELFDACRRTTGSDARFEWVDDEFLIREDVTPWTRLPLWLPAGGTVPWTATGWRLARSGADNLREYLAVCSEKAIRAGLRFRPLAETIHDTLAAVGDAPPTGSNGIGLSRAEERELLARWADDRALASTSSIFTGDRVTTLYLSFEELRDRVSATLEKAGLRSADARAVAENLVEAEARDLGSHGLLLLPVYVRRIMAGGIRAEYAVTLVNDGGAAVLLDGGAGPGQAVAQQAMAMAVARAKSLGISWVTVRNTNHIGMMTSYAMQAVEQGLIGIVMSNTSRAVAPYGGVGRRIGTNPICIAVPTLDDPFILDIATTTVSNGRVRLAALRGEPIAPDWITDADGLPTVDPTALDRGGHLTPLGGHKGYGLAVAVDLLTGILGGGPSSAQVTSQIAHPDSCVNATQTFIALDSEALGGRDSVCAAAHSYLAMLRNTPPLRADSPVLVPGDLEAAALRSARARGVALTKPILEALSEAEQMVGRSPATAAAVAQEAAC